MCTRLKTASVGCGFGGKWVRRVLKGSEQDQSLRFQARSALGDVLGGP